MERSRIPIWLVASIVLTALFSLYSISYRYKVEQKNKAVSIALEYETVEAAAAAENVPIEHALQSLKEQGLGSIVLSEEYIADLQNAGLARITPDAVVAMTRQDEDRIRSGLSIRYPGPLEMSKVRPHPKVGIGIPDVSPGTLRGTAIGLNPEQAAIVKLSGLDLIARMGNPAGVTGEYVRQTIDWAHELGAHIFLPMGDQVLGRRDALGVLTDALAKNGMLYASPEFTKLGGDQNVLDKAPDLVVRLHSAQAAELDKLPLAEAVDRYSRAARERGMRVLLVRPLSFASPSPLNALKDFVGRINKDCQRQGLTMREAHPYDEPHVPTWLFLLIGLSIVPTAFFAGSAFVSDRKWQIAGLVAVLAIGALAATNHGRSYTALLGALAFPTAAFVVLDRRARPNIVLDFILVSLISLVGGLAVAGLLNSLPYYIRAEQFEGVKLAVFLPIALVAYYFLSRGTDLKAAMRNPMTWGAAVISLVILGGLAFMSSRTGNDNPAGVSDLELKMRFFLDQVLLVRPRTKEVMIGHPLLVLGIGLLALQRLRPNPRLALWTALALAGGAIGQTDIVNTMCHIHTPVHLSLMRIGVGMVSGCIIGLAVWVVARRWLPAGEA